MTLTSSGHAKVGRPSLNYNPTLKRNIGSRLLTITAGVFAAVAVLPLILVLGYILFKGASKISYVLFTELPPPPGLDGGGIGNAVIGTLVVTLIAALVAVPVGVGGGIFLAEYSRNGKFAQFIRFGTNVLAGVPSIIAGVVVYGTVVSSRIVFGNAYSALAGGLALSILMLPTVIKTTDEGLKLVPDDLRRAALGVGASRVVTIIRITLPSAFTPIATGVMLGIARAAGETAPLIFTALFSQHWSTFRLIPFMESECYPINIYWNDSLLDLNIILGNKVFNIINIPVNIDWTFANIGCLSLSGVFEPIASLSVLIYNFANMPYETQTELAWAASFVLVAMILVLNLISRWLSRFASR